MLKELLYGLGVGGQAGFDSYYRAQKNSRADKRQDMQEQNMLIQRQILQNKLNSGPQDRNLKRRGLELDEQRLAHQQAKLATDMAGVQQQQHLAPIEQWTKQNPSQAAWAQGEMAGLTPEQQNQYFLTGRKGKMYQDPLWKQGEERAQAHRIAESKKKVQLEADKTRAREGAKDPFDALRQKRRFGYDVERNKLPRKAGQSLEYHAKKMDLSDANRVIRDAKAEARKRGRIRDTTREQVKAAVFLKEGIRLTDEQALASVGIGSASVLQSAPPQQQPAMSQPAGPPTEAEFNAAYQSLIGRGVANPQRDDVISEIERRRQGM